MVDKNTENNMPGLITAMSNRLKNNNLLINRISLEQEELTKTNTQLYKKKNDLQEQVNMLQRKIEVLDVEKKVLMEQNCTKNATIKKLIVESMMELILHRTSEKIRNLESQNSLQQSSQNFKLDDFFLRSSRGATGQLKTNLMNSTKKKNVFTTNFPNVDTKPNIKNSGNIIQPNSETEKAISMHQLNEHEKSDSETKYSKLSKNSNKSFTPDFNKINTSLNDESNIENGKRQLSFKAPADEHKQDNTFEIKPVKPMTHNFSFGFYDYACNMHSKPKQDNKALQSNSNISIAKILRIMDYVTIDKYYKFNQIQDEYDKIFINNYNTQANIIEAIKNGLKSNNSAFFICMGPEKSGKTFTFQGIKKYPGILPHLLKHLDYSKEKHLQIFDIRKKEVEDLICINFDQLNSISKLNTKQAISTLKVNDAKHMNKIFRTIFSYRGSKKDPSSWSLFVKIYDPLHDQCFCFIDSCTFTYQNKETIDLIKLICSPEETESRSDTIYSVIFDMIDSKARYTVNIISHIQSINDEESISQLNKFLDN